MPASWQRRHVPSAKWNKMASNELTASCWVWNEPALCPLLLTPCTLLHIHCVLVVMTPYKESVAITMSPLLQPNTLSTLNFTAKRARGFLLSWWNCNHWRTNETLTVGGRGIYWIVLFLDGEEFEIAIIGWWESEILVVHTLELLNFFFVPKSTSPKTIIKNLGFVDKCLRLTCFMTNKLNESMILQIVSVSYRVELKFVLKLI